MQSTDGVLSVVLSVVLYLAITAIEWLDGLHTVYGSTIFRIAERIQFRWPFSILPSFVHHFLFSSHKGICLEAMCVEAFPKLFLTHTLNEILF